MDGPALPPLAGAEQLLERQKSVSSYGTLASPYVSGTVTEQVR